MADDPSEPVLPHDAVPLFDPSGLLRAVLLVLRSIIPVVVGAAILVGLLQIAFLVFPGEARYVRRINSDYVLVRAQLERIKTVPRADLGLIGDSSCTMGIDATSLAPELGRVESYCTIAYVGPQGYGEMLRQMMANGTAPDRLLVVMHPSQFQRSPDWARWPLLIENPTRVLDVIAPPLTFPQSALQFLRFDVVAKLVYNPLPDHFGRYYGGEDVFRAQILAQHGSSMDPYRLKLKSIEQAARETAPPRNSYDFTMNPLFHEALAAMAPVLAEYGPERVYFTISPLREINFQPYATGPWRAATAAWIARELGIPVAHILVTPPAYPLGFFSTPNHLNRMGRRQFSADISAALLAAGAAKD